MPVETISLARLAIGLIPAAMVLLVWWKWSLPLFQPSLALMRMVLQLLMIGFLLTFIFETNHGAVVLQVCAVMILVAAGIALRTIPSSWQDYGFAALAILVGGGIPYAFSTQLILQVDPWFEPRVMVPLAGMVFANGMNAVSLAAERFESEKKQDKSLLEARSTALKTALIPITNGLLAVGLVSIPGMMTGQVLAGVSPFVAARYQIMIMLLVYGSAGLSSIGYLQWKFSQASRGEPQVVQE
jgi:putative ABC transport system permease protein